MSELTSQNGNTITSVLKIPRVVYDSITFKRLGFKNDDAEETKISFKTSVQKKDDRNYRVTLKVIALRPEEYEASVQISGFCEIDESYEYKSILLEQNAVAILFAYVRAELTLITSQPETDPIVLPVVNINAMMQNATQDEPKE